MTMVSFRVDDDDARAIRDWAERLGQDRSELLRDALRAHLVRLSTEHERAAWVQQPLTDAERSLGDAAEWGPAEDWADWADATG